MTTTLPRSLRRALRPVEVSAKLDALVARGRQELELPYKMRPESGSSWPIAPSVGGAERHGA